MSLPEEAATSILTGFSLRSPHSSSILERRVNLADRKCSPATSTLSKVAATSEHQKRTRTPKACDRCRVKKSKCDGGHPCRRCTNDDSPCLYLSRGVGGRRTSVFETLALTSKALQIMYKAAQNGTGFPGKMRPLPADEDPKNVSATYILDCLGLIGEGLAEPDSIGSSPSLSHSPLELGYRQSSDLVQQDNAIEIPQNPAPEMNMFEQIDWNSMSFSKAMMEDSVNAFQHQHGITPMDLSQNNSGLGLGFINGDHTFSNLPQFNTLPNNISTPGGVQMIPS